MENLGSVSRSAKWSKIAAHLQLDFTDSTEEYPSFVVKYDL